MHSGRDFFLFGVPSPPSPPGRSLHCAGRKGLALHSGNPNHWEHVLQHPPFHSNWGSACVPRCVCAKETRGCSLPSLLPESGGEAAAPPQRRHLSPCLEPPQQGSRGRGAMGKDLAGGQGAPPAAGVSASCPPRAVPTLSPCRVASPALLQHLQAHGLPFLLERAQGIWEKIRDCYTGTSDART